MPDQDRHLQDDAVVQMVRDRFNNVDRDNQEILEMVKTHIEKDEEYWKKIDDQYAQIRLIKWLASGGIGTAIATWFYNTFKH